MAYEKQHSYIFNSRNLGLLAALCFGAGICMDSATAAGPPLPFDGYSVTDGAISAACPVAGAECNNGVSDDGMLQREIILPNGERYFQFILTEPGVSGNAAADPFTSARGSLQFSNEDFVKLNNRYDGISSKQTIIDSTFSDPVTEQRFVNEATYNYGWAQSATNPWLVASQSISTVDYSGDPLNPVETFKTTADININAGSFDGYADVVLTQAVDLSDDSNSGVQKYQYEKVGGGYNPTDRTADGTLLPNGADISWNALEAISALWIGQVLNTASPAADATLGYTRYKNITTGAEASYTSTSDPEAVNWPPPATITIGSTTYNVTAPFGPVDTIASGMSVVSPTASVSAPLPLAPTVSAGTGSADNTVVNPPLAFDSWSVTDGVVLPLTCPGTAVCYPPIINEEGVFQRIVEVGGIKYVQTILTDKNATGSPSAPDFDANSLAFKNETFVRYSSFVNGIAANLHIAEQNLAYRTANTDPLPSDAGQFIYNTLIKKGWAHGGALDPTVNVDQTIQVGDDYGTYSSSMYDKFNLKRGESVADTSMDMFTVVGTSLGDIGYQDPIMFATSLRSGAFQNTAHDGVTDPLLLPSVNGNISWTEGDAVQVTWVGGDYPTITPAGRSKINSTSYTNLSTGERIESTATDGNVAPGATITIGPETWDAMFGPAPTYSDPFVSPLTP